MSASKQIKRIHLLHLLHCSSTYSYSTLMWREIKQTSCMTIYIMYIIKTLWLCHWMDYLHQKFRNMNSFQRFWLFHCLPAALRPSAALSVRTESEQIKEEAKVWCWKEISNKVVHNFSFDRIPSSRRHLSSLHHFQRIKLEHKTKTKQKTCTTIN